MNDATYLTSKGWVETPGDTPWRWSDPKYPAAFFRAQEAVDIQKSRDKSKKGKVNADH